MSKFKIVLWVTAIIGIIPLQAESAVSICTSDPSNMVQNCGFETGNTSSWTQTGNWATSYNHTTTSPNSGNYSLAVGNYNYQGLAGVSQSLTDIAGVTYNVSFWLLQTDSNTNNDANGSTQSFTASWDGTSFFKVQNQPQTNWTQYSFNLIGTGSNTISFSGYSSSGYNLLDDINVHAVPEPEEWAMMLLGFGLVGYQIKRKQRKALPAVA
jgi:hypothetical protein